MIFQQLSKGGLRWLFLVIVFELALVYAAYPSILSDHPWINSVVTWLQSSIPAINYFGSRALNPEAVHFYLAVTVLLIPIKIACWYAVLNGDRMGWYRHLVISPLTDESPASSAEFAKEPLYSGGHELRPEQNSRSMSSRVVWSILILLFAAGMAVVVWVGGTPEPDYFTRNALKAMSYGGLSLWVAWSIKKTTFLSGLLAISICIIRDYVLYFFQSKQA